MQQHHVLQTQRYACLMIADQSVTLLAYEIKTIKIHSRNKLPYFLFFIFPFDPSLFGVKQIIKIMYKN
jgi:hypothetical protein